MALIRAESIFVELDFADPQKFFKISQIFYKKSFFLTQYAFYGKTGALMEDLIRS